MSWNVNVAKRALKEIRRIPKKDAKRLFNILEDIRDNPYKGNIAKIKGEDSIWRKRVGNYKDSI